MAPESLDAAEGQGGGQSAQGGELQPHVVDRRFGEFRRGRADGRGGGVARCQFADPGTGRRPTVVDVSGHRKVKVAFDGSTFSFDTVAGHTYTVSA
ncbi:hypothetical protein GCM10023196_018040 [Actinoallomurus vinaceus]|uniref:Uncharacterized protein n=1 Tax=Actinoallomurus vinaceus TaxID=1080074 RepID=A0ABP8U5W1_9ACTN